MHISRLTKFRFLGVDAYWAFCMAVNIYLVFYRGYNTRQLRGLDRKYFIACYGLALIPAIIYLFIETKERGKIYGGAVVSKSFSHRANAINRFDIAVVLGVDRVEFPSHCSPLCFHVVSIIILHRRQVSNLPRVAVLIAIVIYIMAGRDVWKKRDALDGFLNPFNEDPFTSVIMTTEVTITTEDRRPSIPNFKERDIGEAHAENGYDAYSVNIELGQPKAPELSPRPSRPAIFNLPSVTRAVALSQENVESFLYARVAFLFFIALLVTWVPSSVNRAYALAHPRHLNYGLNFTSAFVFSIQGLLNCMVYMATSRTACRRLWAKMLKRSYDSSGRKESFTTYAMGSEGERSRGQRLDSDATSVTNLTAR